MKYKSSIFSRTIRLAPGSWREALESLRVVKSMFRKLTLLLTDGLTKEFCISVHLFGKAIWTLGRKSGWLFAALYLKQARVALQRYVAQDSIPELSVYVSLTKSGIPRIIPSFHRARLRRGDLRIIKLYMSLFSLSKFIALAAKVTPDTFSSIITPSNLTDISQVAGEMRPYLKDLLVRYIPRISSLPLYQGLRFDPTWKSLPNTAWYRKLLAKSGDDQGRPLLALSKFISCFTVLPYELAAFQSLSQFVAAAGDQFSQGCLWYQVIRYPFDSSNTAFTNAGLEWFEKRIGPFLPSPDALGVPAYSGRLCASCTGDGKRRIFAIGNYINQRLLAPLHAWLASVLKLIPMDGTFDQTKPLDLLAGSTGVVSSIDLKSATDRWPLLLLFELIQCVFGRSFASSAVNSALAANVFQVAFVRNAHPVCFVAGQPLGYLSSWPLFALSHHMLIWWAAEQVYPGGRFRKYAILGDDVVIADIQVKDVYIGLLSRLGVGISVAKSLTSPTGACEFAKRFRLDRMTKDVSPISLKKIFSSSTPMGWYQLMQSPESNNLRISTCLRLGGMGFKAASRTLLSKKHGIKGRRYMILLYHARTKGLDIVTKVGCLFGRVVSPNMVGELRYLLLKQLMPKEPILPPSEVFAYPGMADFNEYTLYQGWMRQYLTYLKWYVLAESDPNVSLDHLLEPPIYTRTWFKPATDVDQFRFSLVFRLFDMIGERLEKDYLSLDIGRSTGVQANELGNYLIGAEGRFILYI